MAHPRSATLDPLPRSRAAEAATDLVGRVDRVEPVGQVAPDPVDRAATDLAGQVAQAAQATTDPVAHGTAMTTAATSTTLRGGTDPHPGVLASHRDRHGTGRFRRPVDRGTTGRSTIGATRKRLSGTRSSTSSASTSSEFGSRCKDSLPRRPLRRLAERALPIYRSLHVPFSNALPTTRCTLGDNAQIPEKSPKSSVTLGKWRRCGRSNQGAP